MKWKHYLGYLKDTFKNDGNGMDTKVLKTK